MKYETCSKNIICGLVAQVDEAAQVYVERNTTPTNDPDQDASVSRFMMSVLVKYGPRAEELREEVPTPALRCEDCIYSKINAGEAQQ